jgi:hypothetical protein
VPWGDGEAVVVLAHVLVLRHAQGDHVVALRPAALAAEVEQVAVGQDLQVLPDLFDPVVDLPQEGLVLGGSLLARIHRPILGR